MGVARVNIAGIMKRADLIIQNAVRKISKSLSGK
jgi:hypothetical protein